jgi:hypothetical protein
LSKNINWAWIIYLVIKIIIEKSISAKEAANIVASKSANVDVDKLLKLIPNKYL